MFRSRAATGPHVERRFSLHFGANRVNTAVSSQRNCFKKLIRILLGGGGGGCDRRYEIKFNMPEMYLVNRCLLYDASVSLLLSLLVESHPHRNHSGLTVNEHVHTECLVRAVFPLCVRCLRSLNFEELEIMVSHEGF